MAQLTSRAQSEESSPGRSASAVLVLSGAALFGTIGTAQALGPDVPAPQLAAARLLLAATLLVLVAVATGHRADLTVMWRHRPTWWAGVGQAGFNLCFLAAMNEAGVAVGTLVAIGATPILTGLASRHVTRLWLGATGIAVTGLVLLVAGQMDTSSAPSVPGVVLALGASASYATYIIAGKKSGGRGLETQPYLATSFTIAAVLTLPLLFIGDATAMTTPAAALLVAYLAVLPTVVAYSLFNRGLHGVRSSTASTLGLIEPVVAAALAVLLVGERLSPVGVLGGSLVVTGLLFIVLSVRDSSEHVPTEIG